MTDKQQEAAEPRLDQPTEIDQQSLDAVAGGQRKRGGEDDDLEDLEIQRRR